MDMLQKELEELKGFIADLKNDRAAQKEKEKREAWTRHTSLSLVLLAVLAAVATQWGGKFSSRVLVNLNDSTFQQSQASDQWSYYQAKSIKQNLYEITREQLPKNTEPTAVLVAAQSDKLSSKIEKYEEDKKQIQSEARGFEEKRDEARAAAMRASRQGSAMGLAVSIYQIAIAMGSICLVVKKKPLWYLSLLLGALATAQMIYAFYS
jgi:hypothetical protein